MLPSLWLFLFSGASSLGLNLATKRISWILPWWDAYDTHQTPNQWVCFLLPASLFIHHGHHPQVYFKQLNIVTASSQECRTICLDSPELVCSSSPAARSWKRINPDAQRAALATFPTADHIQTVPADVQAPVYLVGRCVRVSSNAGRARLRSASSDQLVVPQTSKKTFDDKAFSSTGPISWNCLSSLVRDDCLSLHSFKKLLKTALF